LAQNQFRTLQQKFEAWGTPLPGGDRELVYAPLGTPEADDYLDDMALGANFATVNHLLINALVLEAFQQVFPGVHGQLVYFISHNIARKEIVDDRECWVHRKGATRAFPAGHHALKGTAFADTGHPILLPGNPRAGSVVMVTITEHHIMMPTRLQAGQLTFQIMNDTKHERDLQITGDGVDTSLLDPIDAGDNGELIITLHPGPYTATVLDGENGSPGIKLQFTAIPFRRPIVMVVFPCQPHSSSLNGGW